MERDSTDKRLDDLNAKVDYGFVQVDHRLAQIDQRFDQVDQRLGLVESDLRTLASEVKSGFERMEERIDARFDSLHRLLIQFCGILLAAVIGLFATQV